MKIYDISLEIFEGMAVYKNKADKQPRLQATRDFSEGEIYESRITLDLHTGTHLDAPLHVFKNGGDVGDLELAKLITRCRVLDLTSLKDKVRASDLAAKKVASGEFLLLKTKNSFAQDYDPEFVYLDEEGARYLVGQKIKGVGIDSLGIERGQQDYATHKTLLGAGVIVLEGLRLAGVEEDEYLLLALPLKIRGAEAAPTRAVLLKGDPGIFPP